jgi:hypothetical protein
MARHVVAGRASEFDIRRYCPADRAEVAALYEQVCGGNGSAWLSWRYEDNPYVNRVPMAVATVDGEVVAATPAVAFELRVGTDDCLALQLAEPVVHPDYRTTDVVSRTVRRLQSVYADRDPALFFSVSARESPPVDDFRAVARLPTAYRVSRPRELIGDDAGRGARALARVLGPLARLSHRLRDSAPTAGHVTHSNHVPVGTLTGLARDHRPTGIHAVRDPKYLAWRFGNPEWSYTTYLAGETGVRAAMVVGERHTEGTHAVALTDIYPPAVEDRVEAVTHIVRAVIADHPHADWIVADGTVLPRRIRRRTGFRCDDRRPLSWLCSPTTLFACPATGPDPTPDEWEVCGRDVRDQANWHLSLAERGRW